MTSARDYIWICRETHWSLTFPAGEEPDAGVMRDCLQAMPNFVPLYMTKVYSRPGSDTLCQQGYFVIGSWHQTPPDDNRDPLPVTLPGKGGHVYEEKTWALDWPKGTREKREQHPPQPLTPDGELSTYVRAYYHYWSNTSPEERQRDYNRMSEWKYERAERAMDALHETLTKEIMHSAVVDKAIEEGRFLDPPSEPQKTIQTAVPSTYTGTAPSEVIR